MLAICTRFYDCGVARCYCVNERIKRKHNRVIPRRNYKNVSVWTVLRVAFTSKLRCRRFSVLFGCELSNVFKHILNLAVHYTNLAHIRFQRWFVQIKKQCLPNFIFANDNSFVQFFEHTYAEIYVKSFTAQKVFALFF